MKQEVYILTTQNEDTGYESAFVAWFSKKPTAEMLAKVIEEDTECDELDDLVVGLLKDGCGDLDEDTSYSLQECPDSYT